MYALPGQETPCHKVSLLGDASVGKTCILDYMTKKQFNPKTKPSVGVSTSTIDIYISDKKFPLSIWDTAGQETYRSLVPLYTRNSEVLILVFDITNVSTYESLPQWIAYIRDEMSLSCPVFLVANKIDCNFVVPKTDIDKFASENNLIPTFTSAKTGQGIQELFQDIAVLISNSIHEKTHFSDTPQLEKARSKKGCC